ncbi:MAG: malonyl-CoA synthase [Gammaproteobacteria bacterium]|nr:MAG: malonyl-CoA synthase [Gammaproteobacteria bacterium]
MSENVYTLFVSRFPADRRAPFLEIPEGRGYSYADLDTESARYARFLAGLGLVPGDRVMVQVEKSPQALFFYLACLRAGFIYVPLNTAYRQAEIEYFLDDATPRFVLCDPVQLDMIRAAATARGVAHVHALAADGRGTLTEAAARAAPDFGVAPVAADDTAVILYTSGTTGRPKGAMITHRNLAANGLVLSRAWGFRPDDVLLHALPTFHIHGLFVACHCVLLSGGKMIFMPKFDAAEVIRHLPRATVFMGVPTYYTRLLALPDFGAEACRNMRLFTCGSAPLLPQTFEEFRARTGHTILERYGMTETGMNTSNPLDGARRAGTVGPALPGVTLRVVDIAGREVASGEVGELQVKGDNVFRGYWCQPDKTREEFTADGFFRTGDLARRDADGYVAIVGRAKDLIITGGLNVYPKEIESYLDKLDGIAESAVIGLPHPDFGEAVTAVVVRQPGRDDVDEQTILAALKGAIAGFKVPKRVFFAPDLPRNTMGKVQKNILRERYTAETR